MNTSDIRYLVNTLDPKGIPVVTPAGVLGGHLDAMKFCEHIPQEEYPAGALAAASTSARAYAVWSAVRYRASATRTAKRSWPTSSWYASPARAAYSRISQIKYVIDRLEWLYENRHLIGGLRFTYEPPVLRSSWRSRNRPPTGRHA